MTLAILAFCLRLVDVYLQPGWGELPYIGRYHLPVLWPPFYANKITPNDPFFTTVHTQWLFFSKLQGKISNFCQFSAEKGNFSLKFDNIYTKWPPMLESLHKKVNFFRIPYPMTPFFIMFMKFYTECPFFCSPVETYPSLSCSSAPRDYNI